SGKEGEAGWLGGGGAGVVGPGTESCRARGIDVSGPFPADTVFVRARRGDFDVVVACYHDQGLIPVKLLAFGQAVNVTLGLPIIRTSVDHGTAFDIAGKGVADPESMIAAVLLAARLARAAGAGVARRRESRVSPIALVPEAGLKAPRHGCGVLSRSCSAALQGCPDPMAERSEREKAQSNIAENR